MARETKEAHLSKQVIAYLDELCDKGLPVFYEHRSGSGGFNYKKGIPDFYMVVNGIHVEVELKAPNGKLSTMQEKFKYHCETKWNILYCCPRTIEEFKAFLNALLPADLV